MSWEEPVDTELDAGSSRHHAASSTASGIEPKERHEEQRKERNFEWVFFGDWQIRTWYHSPYPISSNEEEVPGVTAGLPALPPIDRSVHSQKPMVEGTPGRNQRRNDHGENSTLWVCDHCFKYMIQGNVWELHCKSCNIAPPGKAVYQYGNNTIWEVDGAKAKMFCQSLCLFGKFFIAEKTLFFDCDNLLFYILTWSDSQQRQCIVGFFSKEKLSYDDYNLACIVTFPPYQNRGYGMLMIGFSYELSRHHDNPGTPERPLSNLGLRCYLRYWITILVRFFRHVLSLPPLNGSNDDLDPFYQNAPGTWPQLSMIILRCPSSHKPGTFIPSETTEISNRTDSTKFTPFRLHHTRSASKNLDGSVNNSQSNDDQVSLKCTLAEISAATALRIDDITFAMIVCGLLQRSETINKMEWGTEQREEQDVMVVISREMVEKVALERGLS